MLDMLRGFGLMLGLCNFSCLLLIQGSGIVPPVFFAPAPTPAHHSNGNSPGPQSQANFNGVPLAASPIPLSNNRYYPLHAARAAPSRQARTPLYPKMPLQSLPPPPPQEECSPLACVEPLTYGPVESPCLCVLPIQVGIRLTISLYTFFPLVSTLASEIASGVFMKQSQVRIIGANAAGDDPQETVVLIYLLPLEGRFDDATTYSTYKRFWSKQVIIRPLFFGEINVLYVRYPGLPPSPPSPSSCNGIIPSKPYLSHHNDGRTVKPLGVDVRKNGHRHHWPSESVLWMIILSILVVLVLMCGVFGGYIYRTNLNPPAVLRSLAKSSALSTSVVRSGSSSPSFSLGSAVAACTISAKKFSSSEIERATEFLNESRILGEGGFGCVYRGVLDDGAEVAIKILKRYDQQGSREFLAEVEMLSRLHHRNLVKLIGICVEERARCLVYELVSNGSVESHLHGVDKERSPLDWWARLKIALGAARALSYLHEDSSPRVIHRDFKSSNVLLEDDFTPKVSDFGLARAAFDEVNKHISTRVMGTFGYVAPEYAMTGHLLVKSDVYSYGVVLLELLTGRKPVDMSQPPGRENLVSWARPLLTNQDDLELIIDPSLGPDVPFDSVAKVAAIASMCVQPEVSNRPFMGEVVQALKLVCDERDETTDSSSGRRSPEDTSILVDDDRESTSSQRNFATPSSATDYDSRVDFSMSSELFRDRESGRRHSSSSGPLRTGKGTRFWKRMSKGSVSDHRLFKFWPGSH
ncbi:receptor-like serine/threonine-protein kinase ALE2 isoform X2 [Andrographis paniculata]|uniref:receptor-like serine/threonine-protein kinase ALE2 isoform X2 n=1 Tax=Andrographis paniculata TaxID=175694 RepID=UPI0021E96DFB|nr:receptor-like serine/threonine-protein kinase ALE2 isoform X2 [Andrographis paniculata]